MAVWAEGAHRRQRRGGSVVPEFVDVVAPITAVTVFRDGARVARTGTLSVEAGGCRAVIGDLPATADAASVRVALRGHAIALLDVEVQRRYGTDPLRADAARLRAEVEAARDAVQALDDEDAAEQAALRFSGHLSEAAAQALARAVSYGRVGHDDLDQMAAHLSASTAQALARRREIAARRRAAHREFEAAEQRLADAERGTMPVEFIEVAALIEATAAGEAVVELTYHVSGVSWRPLYDLGLAGEQITISYLAEITQQTGEDWPEVELAVSTSRQGRHQTLPELRPWYIDRARPPRPPMAPMVARSARLAESDGAVAQELAFASGSGPAGPPQAAPMQAAPMQAAQVDDSGAGLVYRITRPIAVPSDGSPHKTAIASIELAAKLDHLAVPALAAEAYLRATVTNESRLLLLPGRARVFHEGQFVGETTMETVAAGAELELQLGVDDQVKVERELRRRSTSKAVLGGSRTVDIAYEITIENHRGGQARVSVHDHIPVSADGDIKVRLRETSPDPGERTDLGELIWDLVLDSGKSGTIRYRFTVEHAASVTVTGL
jgi:uncharacterized protein (TIGR02231 family)